MNKEQRAELRKAAEEATSAQWETQFVESARFAMVANPAAILSLLDYVESLERDAARYRYLRAVKPTDPHATCFVTSEDGHWIWGQELDSEIDAAMGESK